MKLLLIVNPVAGRRRSSRRLQALLGLFDGQGDVTVRSTGAPGEAARLIGRDTAEYDVIACIGGDGTLHETVCGVLARRDRPSVAFIPMGTSNDLAHSLRLPRDGVRAARLILDGYSAPIDIGRMNEAHFVYIASFGTFSDVVFHTPQPLKNRLGKLAYVVTGALRLPRLHSHRAVVTHDQGTMEAEFALLAITNARRAAGGFIRYGADQSSLRDGLFEVLMVRRPRHFPHMLAVLLKMTLNLPDSRYIHRVQTTRLHVRADAPIPWCVDGENGGAHAEMTITVVPGGVRMVQPRPDDAAR